MTYLPPGPNLHLLIFQLPYTAMAACSNCPNLPRKDNQSEFHGEGSVQFYQKGRRPTGAHSPSGSSVLHVLLCPLTTALIKLSLNDKMAAVAALL